MSVVAFPLASHQWCAVDPVGWNASTETTETFCSANVTYFFGDNEGIAVSFTDDGRVSFAKEGEYVGGKYAGRVLTDEQFLTDEEEVVEQVATFEGFFPAPAIVEGITDPIFVPGIVPTSPVPGPVSPIVPTPIYPVIDPTPVIPQDSMPEVHTTTLTQLLDPMPPDVPITPAPAPVPLPPALALVATGVAMLSLVKLVLNRSFAQEAV